MNKTTFREWCRRIKEGEKVVEVSHKDYPVYSGFIKYFPNAIMEISNLSLIANNQHNPGEPLHWAMDKSTDEPDAMMRHLIEHAKGNIYDTDGVRHLTKVAWRANALLERELNNENK